MLNWIVWNRTICIKMDLALNNLQGLICHKTQPTNQKQNSISNQHDIKQCIVKINLCHMNQFWDQPIQVDPKHYTLPEYMKWTIIIIWWIILTNIFTFVVLINWWAFQPFSTLQSVTKKFGVLLRPRIVSSKKKI